MKASEAFEAAAAMVLDHFGNVEVGQIAGLANELRGRASNARAREEEEAARSKTLARLVLNDLEQFVQDWHGRGEQGEDLRAVLRWVADRRVELL